MKEVFEDYSKYYDIFYRQKDYAKECDVVEQILLEKKTERGDILDLGCGTGGHALIFARKGWRVAGIDFSRRMLEQAEQKARQENLEIEFHHADICSFDLSRKFDAAIAMFAVVGYLTTNSALCQFFSTVRRHLNQDCLFVFDTWFGPAVIHQRPSERFSVFQEDGETIIRLVTPRLDCLAETVEVHYKVYSLLDEALVEELEETHKMRFFFAQEIRLLLESHGFALENVVPFGQLTGIPDESNWNVTFVARSV